MSSQINDQEQPIETPEPAANIQAAPVQPPIELRPPAPDPTADPVVRAAIEKARTDAIAAERASALASADQLKVTVRAEVEAQLRAEAEESARVAAMSAQEQLQHELEKSRLAIAARDAEVAAAKALADASAKALEVAKALGTSGLRLAVRGDGTVDKSLETIVYQRIAESTAAGLSEADAIAELAKTDPHLFARNVEPAGLTSTAPAPNAPRGTVSQPRSPSAGGPKNWLTAPKAEYQAYRDSKAYLADVVPTKPN